MPDYQTGVGYLRIADIVAVLFVGVYLYSIGSVKICKEVKYILYILIIYMIYSIIVAYFTPFGIERGIVQIIEMLLVLTILVSLSHLFSVMANHEIEVVLLVIYLVCIWAAIIHIFGNIPYFQHILTPLQMIGSNNLLSFAVFYSIFYYMDNKRKRHLLVFFIVTIAILVGGRRSEMIFIPVSMITVYVLFIMKHHMTISPRHLLEVAGSALLVSVFGYITGIYGINRMVGLFQGGLSLFDGRILRWSGGISGLNHFPLGVGLGNYSSVVEYVANLESQLFIAGGFLEANVISARLDEWAVAGVGAHSTFFRMMVEGSLIGIAAFLFFWMVILRLIIQSKYDRKIGVLSVMMMYLFLNSLFNEEWLYTQGRGFILIIFLSIIVGLTQQSKISLYHDESS